MTKREREDIISWNAGGWQAEFSPVGGQLIRLRHELSGQQELLRTPPSPEALRRQPELWGLPVLFPPNRIANGNFEFQGRRYELPLNEPARHNHIHGMLLKNVWNVSRLGDRGLRMACFHEGELGWPHDFRVELDYVFEDQLLVQTISICNCSSEAMPFLLGFHSAFHVTPSMKIRVTAKPDVWTVDDVRKLPDGLRKCGERDWRIFQKMAELGRISQLLSQDDGLSWRGMELDNPEAGYILRYEVDPQFKFWMLWNGDGASDFFCAEPMTCLVNAPNLDLPAEVSGMDWLLPGECRRLVSRIGLS